MYYFGPGGTNGDTWIVIPALRTIVAGDAFAAKALTLIDKNNGGSATGYLQALTRVSSAIKGVDTVITGRDGVLTWSDLTRYVEFNKDCQTWVRAQKQMGKTVEQAAADYKHPDKYQDYAAAQPRLRHTFCSHLAMKGAPARAIQELAGHADLSMTQRYMHLSPAATEDAIRLLDGRRVDLHVAQGVET